MTKQPKGGAPAVHPTPRGSWGGTSRASVEPPLSVEVPISSQDKPAWVKVGAIAAVGFIVGIAWPRLLGVRLGPNAPGEAAAAASAGAAASAQAGRAPEAPPASVIAKNAAPQVPPAASGAAAAPAPSPAAVAAPNITVQKGTVLSCKTAEGETKKGAKECGSVPGLDQLVSPRVRKIATCSGVEGQTGKLSIVVNADFGAGRFSYDIGKSSTVPNVDAIASCLKTSFHGTSTAGTSHEHSRYTVAYTAIFAPGAGGADETAQPNHHRPERDSKNAKDAPSEKVDAPSGGRGAESPSTPSLDSGEAAVAWEVALVRDAPKSGSLVGRLPRGTKVKVGTTKDGWYQVKFGDGFASDGWVYRGAIGR